MMEVTTRPGSDRTPTEPTDRQGDLLTRLTDKGLTLKEALDVVNIMYMFGATKWRVLDA